MNKREKEFYLGQLESEKAVLQELKRQYERALRDINERIKILQADSTPSRAYQAEYQKTLKKQVEAILNKLQADEYSTIEKYLGEGYTNGYVGTMYAMSGQGVHVIVPIDRKAAHKAIITDSKLSFDLYASIGHDMDKLKTQIRREITRGIATSLPYEQIARNIADYAHIPLSNAKRVARTECHRIQQASAHDARQAAKAKGADVVKMYDASLDGATRPLHRKLDGQIREVDEPFEADGKKCMYPGKFGSPDQDCNCRCVALTRARWALDEKELETLQERAKFFGLDKTKDFEEYREKYLKAAETLDMPGKIRYNKGVEMTRKLDDNRRNGRFISQKMFDDLTVPLKKQGVAIMRGTDEVEKRLDKLEAAASVVGDIMFFRRDVLISEVLEESRHFMQNKIKLNDDKPEPLRSILNEIEAKEYILSQTKKYKIPRAEIETTKKQLESYKKQLRDITGEGD